MDSAFTIEDCIHDAIERIGGQAGTASEIRSARRSVRLLLEEWAAMRLNTWRRQSIDLTLPSSEGSHVLPDDVDDGPVPRAEPADDRVRHRRVPQVL